MNQQPDFFLTAFARSPEEGDDWQKARACMVRGKITEQDGTELLLVKVAPKIKCYSWGLEDREIDDLLLSRLHRGTTIDPISEWPFSVFIFGLIDESVLEGPPGLSYINKRELSEVEKEAGISTNLSLQAWGELHQTREEADIFVGVKPEYPREINELEEVEKAKRAFHSIFKNADYEPFTKQTPNRALLISYSNILDEEHFVAVAKAAADLGETTACVSTTAGYFAKTIQDAHQKEAKRYITAKPEIKVLFNAASDVYGKSFEQRTHWLLDLQFYSYEILDIQEYLGVIPNAIYSTNGTWGIIFFEDHALIGGSAAFLNSFKSNLPNVDEEVTEFLDYMKEELETYPNTKESVRNWLPLVIEHVYGRAGANAMLKESGLDFLLM